MYDRYFQEFNKRALLSEEEKEFIKKFLSVRKIRKRQYLLQEGDICMCVGFVERGAMRLYRVNENGSEHIVLFALDGSFITDLYSFLTNEPSTYNIDAIEDSELVVITKSASDELRKLSAKYREFIFDVTSEAYIQSQRRLTSIISLTVEDRYKELTTIYPDIVQRLPQHMIASYIGMTPETLSRVRKRISINK